MWMERGCAAQRLGMMDYCVPVSGMAALSEICVWPGSSAAREAKPTGGEGESGGFSGWSCWDAQKPGFTLASYFLFPAEPEQQMELKMQA